MRRAFSLLEVMVALGIVGMLAASVFAFVLDLLQGRESLSDASRDAIAAAVIIERLEGDLLVGVVGVGDQAGIRGDDKGIAIIGRSVKLPAGSDDRVIGDMVESEIRFDEGRGLLEGRRGGASFEQISDRVRFCRFRYFDGRRWVSSFDSRSAGSLPVAIEIAAWFGSLEERDTLEPSMEDPPEESMLSEGFLDGAPLMEEEALSVPSREPDLLRVMLVPDGPVTSWRDG